MQSCARGLSPPRLSLPPCLWRRRQRQPGVLFAQLPCRQNSEWTERCYAHDFCTIIGLLGARREEPDVPAICCRAAGRRQLAPLWRAAPTLPPGLSVRRSLCIAAP